MSVTVPSRYSTTATMRSASRSFSAAGAGVAPRAARSFS